MSETFDAFHLPVDLEGSAFETLMAGELPCRYPRPVPGLLEETGRRLRDAGARLAERPVADIVGAIDAAAARLLDPGDPLRERAERLLPAAAGYSRDMARLVLDRMAAGWRAGPLDRVLLAELGDPAVLDDFVAPEPGRRVRAYGPGLAFHVFAGNVPGVAVTSLVRSLLVKAPVLGKLAAGEPVLPVLFARALRSVDAAVADALALTYWPGGSADAEAVAIRDADLVVVYGGEAAVASLAGRVTDPHRLVVHGPRFSVGLVGGDALAADPDGVADRVARAVATFDQHGCVSPHAVWVEDRNGEALGLAEAIARALDRLESTLPRGRLSDAEAAAIQQERGAAEMRAHGGHGVRVFAGRGTTWTVVYDPEPAFRPSCLNRFLRVHPLRDLSEAAGLLKPAGAFLQAVAIEGTGLELERLAHRLARAGAARVTRFDQLPWPPPHGHHDGRGPLRELLRWVDLEA